MYILSAQPTQLKGEVSREFGVITTFYFYYFCFVINRNLKVLREFVLNYHPSVLRLSISVSGHRWTGLEWTAT